MGVNYKEKRMIQIVPMTGDDYHAYLAKMIPEYADDMVKAGNWEEDEALELSRKSFEGYLAQGIHTPGQFVCKLVNEKDIPVGAVWYGFFGNRTDRVMIYDLEIEKPFRRRGYATEALTVLEAQIKILGIKKIELSVFGFNAPARDLYKKAGFTEANVNMIKEL